MEISAEVRNGQGEHSVFVNTDGREQRIEISASTDGVGSSVNGGELLMAALGTCYCNDLYREAGKRGIHIRSVRVTVHGDFGEEGESARRIRYSAEVESDAPREQIRELMRWTDQVAEIQKTLRGGVGVGFVEGR